MRSEEERQRFEEDAAHRSRQIVRHLCLADCRPVQSSIHTMPSELSECVQNIGQVTLGEGLSRCCRKECLR
jgi:hypothetical protein